jgi:hypothetical protein
MEWTVSRTCEIPTLHESDRTLRTETAKLFGEHPTTRRNALEDLESDSQDDLPDALHRNSLQRKAGRFSNTFSYSLAGL